MTEKTFLSADQILAADDLEHEDVWVPEWGTYVRVRSLTGRERDAFEAENLKREGKSYTANLENLRARLIAKCAIHHKTGDRLFTQAQVLELGQKNAKPLDRLYAKAQELSGFSDEDMDALVKDSAPDLSD